jgi:hypothetical protein
MDGDTEAALDTTGDIPILILTVADWEDATKTVLLAEREGGFDSEMLPETEGEAAAVWVALSGIEGELEVLPLVDTLSDAVLLTDSEMETDALCVAPDSDAEGVHVTVAEVLVVPDRDGRIDGLDERVMDAVVVGDGEEVTAAVRLLLLVLVLDGARVAVAVGNMEQAGPPLDQ